MRLGDDIMKKYFKNNVKTIVLLLLFILFSGPVFSVLMISFTGFLNKDLGDWLSFYGSMAGTVISVLVIHMQLFLDKERLIEHSRPEFILSNDYQTIKPGLKIYYDNKFWYGLIKGNKNTKKLSVNSFEQFYQSPDKMDKALSIEILNSQPMLNLHLLFDNSSSQIIPRINADEKLYIISKEHQKAIFSHLTNNDFQFNHLPREITLYYTTLSGEIIKRLYRVDDKGNCKLVEQKYKVSYPELSVDSRTCDYIVKT